MVLDSANSSSNHKPRNEPQSRNMLAVWASQTLKKLAFYGYGLFTTLLFMLIALSSGTFFKKPSKQSQLQLKIGMYEKSLGLLQLTPFQLVTNSGICPNSPCPTSIMPSLPYDPV